MYGFFFLHSFYFWMSLGHMFFFVFCIKFLAMLILTSYGCWIQIFYSLDRIIYVKSLNSQFVNISKIFSFFFMNFLFLRFCLRFIFDSIYIPAALYLTFVLFVKDLLLRVMVCLVVYVYFFYMKAWFLTAYCVLLIYAIASFAYNIQVWVLMLLAP